MTTESLDVRFYAPDRRTSVDIADLLRYCGRTFDLTGDDPSSTRSLGPDAVDELPSVIPLEDAIERVSSGRHGALWFREQNIEFGLHIHPDIDDPATFTVSVPDHYVRSSQKKNVCSVIDDIVIPLYEYATPMFVYGGTYLDDHILSREHIESGCIDRAFWLLVFGPQLVETLGKERLAGLSASRFSELSDGGRLVLLTDTPNTCAEVQRADAETVLQEGCGP
ncbi:hypothetical protein [Natrinema salaciae]|uniref:Uncharacterized protein n=1 Tax=Natrinema salaciae TaxID=1186196 RepID=A0A1H9IRB0_9EURY|nr:hypothetical protein [Natrinema salaciae]SEQ77124.1 hypothetical protein SAMN04489841_2310 [Natrinema salaciae]